GRFSQLASGLARHPRVRDFRHRGMIWAFEVESRDPSFASKAFALALERGVLLRPMGNTVYFMPPYVVGDEEFTLMVDAANAIVEKLA
ncbi:MAG TPA: aminotransferase class III-fold pyridoxal phosphate-dependent enzyme, partial [Usitatibacter sp.]|nr:aminotransferase class III-fold pyridoxal phosphate-dependent enzyme [Usitatibacter sp.]